VLALLRGCSFWGLWTGDGLFSTAVETEIVGIMIGSAVKVRLAGPGQQEVCRTVKAVPP